MMTKKSLKIVLILDSSYKMRSIELLNPDPILVNRMKSSKGQMISLKVEQFGEILKQILWKK
jgi:hypothetical protein